MEVPKRGFAFYWRFYWPLSLMGLTAVLSRQMENSVLARYPDAIQEIATFAIASSVFQFFSACFAFVPQLTNVMVVGRFDYRFVLKFIFKILLVQFVILLLVTQTSFGRALMALAFSLSPEIQDKINLYILLMIPNLFLHSLIHVYIGLLIKFERTKAVTISNVAHLILIVFGLLTGLWLEINVVYTIVGSQIFSNFIQLIGTWYYALKISEFEVQEKSDLTTRTLWQFFWPISLTSTMFSFSRPVIYSFVSRLPDGVIIIAALRIAFDFSIAFQNMVNQFRHLYLTYAKSDLKGVVRFMLQTSAIITGIMVFIVASYALRFILVNVMGVSLQVAIMSEEVFWVSSLLPLIICTRNFFHGQSMLTKNTMVMGMAGVLRVGGTALIAWVFVWFGVLNHVTAGFALVFGFFIELFVNAAQYKFKINASSSK